jgi:hypothetical protein
MAGRSDRRDDRRARHDDRRHDRRPGVATFDDRRDRETAGVPPSEAARVCAHQLAVRHQQREMKAKLARGSSSISLPALDRFLSEHCLPKVENQEAMKAREKASKIAKGRREKVMVFLGKKEQTHTGLKKSDLTKNKVGRIVCKKASENGKKAYSRIQPWNLGFYTKKGTPLYTKADAASAAAGPPSPLPTGDTDDSDVEAAPAKSIYGLPLVDILANWESFST